MTKEECRNILATVAMVYHNWHPGDLQATLDAWYFVMCDFDAKQILAAVRAYAMTNTSGFPPSPAQLITQLRPQEDSALNAWSKVYKAICNSTYHSQEEFDKLPEDCQKAVGSPENLRQWAMTDADSITVLQANFIKTYNMTVERERLNSLLPENLKDALGQTPRKAIEKKNETDAKGSEHNERDEKRNA